MVVRGCFGALMASFEMNKRPFEEMSDILSGSHTHNITLFVYHLSII